MAVDPKLLPIDPNTGEPIPPRAQPGYYPGYDVLSQQEFWDDATRRVVLQRVNDIPPIRFFTEEEARFMQAVVDRILPQDDRDELHRIPILPRLDARLHEENVTNGTRYEGMPTDQEAYRLAIKGIEAIARHMHGRGFLELGPLEQDEVLETLHDNRPPAGQEYWNRVHVHRFWLILVGDVVGVYYSHPYAWNEIGFGGPAYPRGYFRLEGGHPEPWEVDEARYLWEPPPASRSGEILPLAEIVGHELVMPGQGGTH